MRAIVALGNPGDRYRDTRHNAGWWLADRLVVHWGLGPFVPAGKTAWTSGSVGAERVELHKPLTYMNRSGGAVRSLIEDRGLDAESEMLVLVDDVWLPPGRFRLRPRGSAGGHNGLRSLSEAIGRDFARLRIGVGKPEDDEIDLADWVLARMPRSAEEEVLGTFPQAVGAVEHWLEHGVEAAMNRYNTN